MAAPPGTTPLPACAGNTPRLCAWIRAAPVFCWPAPSRASSAAKTAENPGGSPAPPAFQVLHIEQSPHDACYWLASTEGGGLFDSTDCGVSFREQRQPGSGPQPLRHRLRSGIPESHCRGRLGSRRGDHRGPRQDLAAPQLRASRDRPSGVWPSIPPSPAASTPACTKTPSMFPRTTAEPGRKTASRAAPSSA